MQFDDAYFDDLYAEGDPWGYYESEYERRKGERPLVALRDQKSTEEVDRILDLGCGNGAKTRLVTEAYPDAEVIGVDLSAEALDAAREWAPDASYERADIVDWVAERDRSFDAVVAIGSLYYLCADYSVTDLFGFADDLRDIVDDDGLLVAAHNHMPRDDGPVFAQERSVRTVRTILESTFETVGRSRYEAEKQVAIDPAEPAEQPYEVWALRPAGD